MPRPTITKYRVILELDVEAHDLREIAPVAHAAASTLEAGLGKCLKNPVRVDIKKARFITGSPKCG